MERPFAAKETKRFGRTRLVDFGLVFGLACAWCSDSTAVAQVSPILLPEDVSHLNLSEAIKALDESGWPADENTDVLVEHVLELLESRPSDRDEVYVHARYGSLLFNEHGDAYAAREFLERAVELGERLRDDLTRAQSGANLVKVFLVLGEFEKAISAAGPALRAAESEQRRDLISAIILDQGTAHDQLGDAEKAFGAYSQALEMAREDNHQQRIVEGLNNVSAVALNMGRLEVAQIHLEEALALTAPEQKNERSAILSNLGDICRQRDDLAGAMELHREALALQSEVGTEAGIAQARFRLGEIYAAMGEYPQALRELEAALKTQERLLLAPAMANSLAALVPVYQALGRSSDAQQAGFEGLRLGERMEMKARQSKALLALSELYGELGDHELAAQCLLQRAPLQQELWSDRYAVGMAEWEAKFNKAESERQIEVAERRSAELQRNASFLVGGLLLVLGWVGWSRFLSGRRERRMLEEKRELEHKLFQSQKLESMGLLAGGVAHDFNNILMGVQGNISLARLQVPGDSPMNEFLNGIEESSKRGATLAQRMLTYSGRSRFSYEPVDVNRLVRWTCKMLPVSTVKNIRLEYFLSPDFPHAHADSTELGRVLMNLVTNAATAIGDEQGTIQVRTLVKHFLDPVEAPSGGLGSLHPGSYVVLIVNDTGRGMNEATRQRIFEPFFTRNKNRKGRGLGLSTVAGIVRSHHGMITVDSQLNRGTSFCVYIPIVETPKPEFQVAEPLALSGAQLTGNVLVIDDDPVVLRTLTTMLSGLGLDVIASGGGRQGLRRFREDPGAVDLVLLDWKMPGFSGHQTLEELRVTRSDVPVVLITGCEDGGIAFEEGAVPRCSVLQKPFTLEELQSAAERAMRSGSERVG